MSHHVSSITWKDREWSHYDTSPGLSHYVSPEYPSRIKMILEIGSDLEIEILYKNVGMLQQTKYSLINTNLFIDKLHINCRTHCSNHYEPRMSTSACTTIFLGSMRPGKWSSFSIESTRDTARRYQADFKSKLFKENCLAQINRQFPENIRETDWEDID